jgi:PAS domain S-box-containing protein
MDTAFTTRRRNLWNTKWFGKMAVFYVEDTAIRIRYDGEPATQGIFRDITARKQTEEALRKSEGKYRLIAENMQDLIGY